MTEIPTPSKDDKMKAERSEFFRDNPLRVREVEASDERNGSRNFVIENDFAGAEVVIDSTGEYFIEYFDVAEDMRENGIGSGLLERLALHARRLRARGVKVERIGAIFVSEESVRAARHVFDESDFTEVMLDAESRYPNDDGYSGPHHPNWLLNVDLADTADDIEQAESRRQQIIELMAGRAIEPGTELRAQVKQVRTGGQVDIKDAVGYRE